MIKLANLIRKLNFYTSTEADEIQYNNELALQLFRKLLGRDIDAAGAQWIKELFAAGGELTDIINLIIRSDEFKTKFIVLPEKTIAIMSNHNDGNYTVSSYEFGVKIVGGVGDLIVSARFLKDLTEKITNLKFTVYYSNPSVAKIIFKNIPGYIESCSFEDVNNNHNKNRIIFKFAGLLLIEKNDKLLKLDDPELDNIPASFFDVIIKVVIGARPFLEIWRNHPFFDNALGRYCYYKGYDRRNFIHGLAGLEYSNDLLDLECDQDCLKTLGLPERYITIHNGFDTIGALHAKKSTKSYRSWDKVVSELKKLGLDLPIIQIGTFETSHLIQNVDINLIGKTDLRQAFTIIANAKLHLDGEGGFVHAAAALNIKSCVIFGSTDPNFYSYPQNLNLIPRECGGCWWLEPEWMYNCPRGLDDPICLSSHKPEEIAEAIQKFIKFDE